AVSGSRRVPQARLIRAARVTRARDAAIDGGCTAPCALQSMPTSVFAYVDRDRAAPGGRRRRGARDAGADPRSRGAEGPTRCVALVRYTAHGGALRSARILTRCRSAPPSIA